MKRMIAYCKCQGSWMRQYHELPIRAMFHTVGILFNPRAVWIGGHYGAKDKRLCINIIPHVHDLVD